MTTSSLLLLVADGRFPAGAHAHSGGLEAAVAAGRVTDLATLEAFLAGRLATAGLVGAAFAAAAHRAVTSGSAVRGSTLALLDAELDARTAAPALRTVSRRQGRALLRAGRAIWPEASFDDLPATPGGAHQPLVLGLLCAAAGLSRAETATVAVHGTVTGAASAAVRLLGLDPYRVQALLVGLAGRCDGTAAAAARAADDPPERLPAAAAPLADIHAEAHATWEVRLFAS
ncbi:urease accessory protein UreF [Micromonospora chalcea]|uniref:urease accessory protein UreF n=1 Tax=Micromonospora TaxID=1873 RepID=UPI001AE78AD0|nr:MULTISPECIES: urease accessory UreF family protein [unclassified Micromonospora]MBP1784259.1 urease accessory protein [Micromonospora sp. HB375]MDH6467250.1 urease accessory protein [Micromonospora sp. H404/HB375]